MALSLRTAKRSVLYAARGCFTPTCRAARAKLPFPADNRVLPEDVNRSGVLFVLTALTLLPAVLCIAVRLAHQRLHRLVGLCRGRRRPAVYHRRAAAVVPAPEPRDLRSGRFRRDSAVPAVYQLRCRRALVLVLRLPRHRGDCAARHRGRHAACATSPAVRCTSSAARSSSPAG